MIGGMFKPTGNQRYEYRPRFYDPDKEALKERVDIIQRAKAGDKEAIKQRMRHSMQQRRNQSFSSKQHTQSNVRVMMIVAVLVGAMIIALQIFAPGALSALLESY